MQSSSNRISEAQIILSNILGDKPFSPSTINFLRYSITEYRNDLMNDQARIDAVMSANGLLETYIFLVGSRSNIQVEEKLRKINFKGQIRGYKIAEKKATDRGDIAFEELKARVMIKNSQLVTLLVSLLRNIEKQTLRYAA